MAHVDPAELKYRIGIRTPARVKDENGHYRDTVTTAYGRAGMRSSKGKDDVIDGAARSVDTVQFIVRWELRQRVTRDSTIVHRDRRYKVDWMDEAPWAGQYARIRAISYDQGEG